MSTSSPPCSPTSSKVNLLDLAASALSSAVVAADQITALCKPGNEKNVRLKNDGSFVTDADCAAQGIIVQSLQGISTKVRLVGEESEEEMEQHIVTGHEERAEAMFRLAQQEILMRYEDRFEDPLPLQQTTGDNPQSSDPSSAQKSDGGALTKLQDVFVDASRVSVFIDPLDGTKAYARGDYDPVSILVAIILDGIPCFGVICKPFGHVGYSAILDTGCAAFYGGTLLGAVYTAGGGPCSWSPKTPGEMVLPRAVISSSRSTGIVEEFVQYLGKLGKIHPEPMMISGAGEKSLRIVLGEEREGLWFFPKPGTSLWDVAASDALLRATGGKLTDKNGKDMDYSKSRTEAENEDGIVACYDEKLHGECMQLFRDGVWTSTS